MTDDRGADHHPLPQDDRARHDLIPESIEDERDRGDDAPEAKPGKDPPEERTYANPDGSPYPA
jgi:hypothetical protein